MDEPASPRDAPPSDENESEGARSHLRARIEATRRDVQERALRLRTRSRTIRIAFDAYERDRIQAGALLAGGLAYRLFVWLLPTALVVVSAVGLIVRISGDAPDRVASSAGLGAALATTVATAVQQTSRGVVYVLIFGIVLMLWAAIGVVRALRLASAVIWRLQPGPLSHPIRTGLVFTAVTVGQLLVPLVMNVVHRAPVIVDVAAEGVAFALVAAIAVWGQGSLPTEPRATWRTLVPGALAFAIGIAMLRIVTHVYLAGRLGRTDDLYGALGLSAVFMAWLYLVARITIAAIGVSASRWHADMREGGGPKDDRV